MKLQSSIVALLSLTLLVGCGPKIPESYPMEKRYWNGKEYRQVVREVGNRRNDPEGLPRKNDPVLGPVFAKLVDKQNVSVILEDETLGLDFRNSQAEDFFHAAGNLTNLYEIRDKQDKYIHQMELVEVIDFYLYTQLKYFDLGNRAIIDGAVNPDAYKIQDLVTSNNRRLVQNCKIYLDLLAKDDAFNDAALSAYAKLIDERFGELVSKVPNADYTRMKGTCRSLSKKIESDPVKRALENLLNKIEEKEAARVTS